MTEQEAIARLKQGDIGGLEHLVQHHQIEALRAVYVITLDRALAEDIVQAAFVRAYERIDQFDINRSFRPWFLRSVINDALKATTQQNRHISWEVIYEEIEFNLTDNLTISELCPVDRVESADLRQTIWQALKQLSAEQRAAIVQRYYLELNEREMAAVADCAPGTIKWRLHAARKRLYELLRPLEL